MMKSSMTHYRTLLSLHCHIMSNTHM